MKIPSYKKTDNYFFPFVTFIVLTFFMATATMLELYRLPNEWWLLPIDRMFDLPTGDIYGAVFIITVSALTYEVYKKARKQNVITPNQSFTILVFYLSMNIIAIGPFVTGQKVLVYSILMGTGIVSILVMILLIFVQKFSYDMHIN